MKGSTAILKAVSFFPLQVVLEDIIYLLKE
jgi:hypothetical protein